MPPRDPTALMLSNGISDAWGLAHTKQNIRPYPPLCTTRAQPISAVHNPVDNSPASVDERPLSVDTRPASVDTPNHHM